jgi:ankyrin repeat protein
MKKFLFIPLILAAAYFSYIVIYITPKNEQLFAAVRANDLPQVETSVKQGASLDARDDAGQTPLHSAVYRGYTEIAEFLISKNADINVKDNRGGTPLHWAAIQPEPNNTVLLMQSGSNPNITDNFEMTPLNWAVSKGNARNVKALLEMGADASIKNSRGKMAIDYARELKNREIVGLLEKAAK